MGKMIFGEKKSPNLEAAKLPERIIEKVEVPVVEYVEVEKIVEIEKPVQVEVSSEKIVHVPVIDQDMIEEILSGVDKIAEELRSDINAVEKKLSYQQATTTVRLHELDDQCRKLKRDVIQLDYELEDYKRMVKYMGILTIIMFLIAIFK